MTSLAASARPVAAGPERRSTRLVFLIAGVAAATWAPLVPFAKARTGAGDGTLGLLLLCLGVGSLAAMPLAGACVARFGCRGVIAVSAALLCLALPPLALVSDPVPLAVALLAFGTALGALDVAMNLQAVIVERDSGGSVMSGFHGLYSLGGIAGAVGVTALLGMGAPPFAATLCMVAGIVVALVPAVPHLLPYGGNDAGFSLALPRGGVLFLGLLCFVAFLSEGAVLDWSALFLTSARGLEPSRAGLGFAVFSLAMTLCRLGGDRVVRRFGGPRILLAGGLCAAAGFALATLVPFWQAALLGYGLVGVGCSNVVPVLYTAARRQTAMSGHAAVSAITTLGYAGILAGPAAIGFVAQISSLSVAFLILAALQLGVAASGRVARG